MSAISDYDLGWLVGILEGEGYFGYLKHTQRVTVQMTDEDIIRRVANLFEQMLGIVCDVHETERNNIKHKTLYDVSLYGEKARTVMRLVVKRMGPRRRKKIHQSLNGFIDNKPKLRLKDLTNFSLNEGKSATVLILPAKIERRV